MKKGDKMYYARILPLIGYYEVEDLIVRHVEDDWFTAYENRDKQVFLFNISDIDKIVFEDRMEALLKVKNYEEFGKKVSDEKFYEEY